MNESWAKACNEKLKSCVCFISDISVGIPSRMSGMCRVNQDTCTSGHVMKRSSQCFGIYRKYVGTFDVTENCTSSFSTGCWLFSFLPPAGRWRFSASARIQLYVSNTTFTASLPARHLHTHTHTQNRGRRNAAGSCFQTLKSPIFPVLPAHLLQLIPIFSFF